MATNAEVMNILASLQQQLAIAAERERHVKEVIDEISDDMDDLKKEIGEMKNMASRWKGGFIMLAGLGGIVGWILSTWGSIIDMFGR